MEIKAITNLTDTNLVQGSNNSKENLKLQQPQAQIDNNQEQLNQKEEIKNLDEKQLKELMDNLKQKFEYYSKYLKIEIDKDLHQPIVKIIDQKTNEVIKQIPPEEILKIMKKIEEMIGVLFKKEI
ncbi:flagellar protein FlaG [Venenivibrio stagnispumantis]|uniref:Flagellar protein FlaG n=1 Tax=Venenivibrio stagnispumantis TaxID=407998 RepID=A0AA46ACJ3_9AQUI|nr:flagellar protein FlaG [Venenivibrio stagnispumantis]MCW4572739.1 flagellar protein FlaG [Venenivibrio stagnispumantis]SMP00230.1 flagellar protein FlaG [Venenivibrio stagnispumantis]